MSEVEATAASTHARIVALEAALARVTQERDLLRGSHERLRLELELLKRRLFVAKAAHSADGDHPFRRIAIIDFASSRSERSDVSL